MTQARGFRRIDQGVDRGDPFTFLVDGAPVQAYRGESVAAALLAAGRGHGRVTARLGECRGPYCAMGLCWECMVVIDGRPNRRACMTAATPEMWVETQHDAREGGGG